MGAAAGSWWEWSRALSSSCCSPRWWTQRTRPLADLAGLEGLQHPGELLLRARGQRVRFVARGRLERGVFDVLEVDVHVAARAPDAGLQGLRSDFQVGPRGEVAVRGHLQERRPAGVGQTH